MSRWPMGAPSVRDARRSHDRGVRKRNVLAVSFQQPHMKDMSGVDSCRRSYQTSDAVYSSYVPLKS
jgi:hypothetical protein